MAITLNGSSQYISKPLALVTATPVSMACWFNPAAISVDQILMAITNSASSYDSWDIWFASVNNKFVAETIAGTTDETTATATVVATTATWYHVCAVYASATSRIIYVNGGHLVLA